MEVKAGYKQTEVGVIPDDWDVQSVGEAFEITNNLRFPISREVRSRMSGQYPYYGPTSVQDWINEFRVEGVYSLIGEDGDHFLKWNSQSMTQLVSGKFNVNNHAHLIQGTKNLTAWFYWFFKNRDVSEFLTRQGAGRFKLSKASLVNIPCALPPTKAEQEAIVEALSDADSLIESLEQLIAKKHQIKQGTMQELLTSKKRLPGFSGNWEEKRLGELLKDAPDYGINAPATGADDRLPTYLRITDIDDDGNFKKTNRVAVNHPFSENYSLGNNEIVFARTGASVGKTYLYNPSDGYLVFAGFLIRAKINTSKLNPVFFFNYTTTSDYWFWVKVMSMRSGQPGINGNEYASLKIKIPKFLEEQEAIAKILSDMDSEIASLESKLSKACQIKQGMMQTLLTGQIRLV